MRDGEAALLCCAVYDRPDYFDALFDVDGVYCGFKYIDNAIHLIFRGSVTWLDWLRDGESIETVEHPVLGTVGKGFIDGVDAFFSAIRAKLSLRPGDTVRLYAHSLGCLHALYTGGLLVNAGMLVELVLFEPPRGCSAKLIQLLEPYPVRCYVNKGSGIPYLPRELAQPRALIQVQCPPVAGDLTPFRYHHMPLLLAAVAYNTLLGGSDGPLAGK